MKFRNFALLLVSLPLMAQAPAHVILSPGERAAWEAIAGRFDGGIDLKRDPRTKVTTLKVEKLKPGGTGNASARVNASGQVTGVTADHADFGNDEFKLFAAFPELEALTLWHNFAIGKKPVPKGSAAGLSHLMDLKKLRSVTLAGGGLNDEGMAAAAKLPRLAELQIWHASFTDAGVAKFRDHPTLEVIKLGPMWTSDLTDKSVEVIATCPKLKHLKFTETWLTWDGGLKHLAKRKETLRTIEFGNALIAPSDLEKLQAALPDAKIAWDGPDAAGKEFLASGWTRGKAAKWIPKEIMEKAEAAVKR